MNSFLYTVAVKLFLITVGDNPPNNLEKQETALQQVSIDIVSNPNTVANQPDSLEILIFKID